MNLRIPATRATMPTVTVPQLQLPRAIASAALMVDIGLEHGVTEADALAGSGVSPDELRNPVAEIKGVQELAIVRNLLAALPDVPGLGLIAGSRYRITSHGIWGFAVMSSQTVAAALDVFVRYFDLSFSFNRAWMEHHGEQIVLVFDNSALPADVRVFAIERDWSALLTLAPEFLPGGVTPQRVSVSFSAPSYAQLYEQLGIAPLYDQPLNEIALPATLLDEPLRQADPHTAGVFERQCAELLNRRRERLGTSGVVRELLLHTRRFTTDQDEVAAQLAISVRTLRRRLADEGTSYRDIVAETAGLLAEELLHAGFTVEDVAHRLGYNGAPAFTVAFKKWKGMTPGAFARSVRPRTSARID